MNPRRTLTNIRHSVPLVLEAAEARNLRVLRNLAGPSYRGLVQQRGKHEPQTALPVGFDAIFNWEYRRDREDLAKLYELAKKELVERLDPAGLDHRRGSPRQRSCIVTVQPHAHHGPSDVGPTAPTRQGDPAARRDGTGS